MIIIPAIIPADFDDLEKFLRIVQAFSPVAQIDFFDQDFVPGYKSLMPRDDAVITSNLNLIAHLLAFKPAGFLPYLAQSGFSQVLFHLEAHGDPHAHVDSARQLGLRVGVVINPATPSALLEEFIGAVDEFVFLAVNTLAPGIFVPEVMNKVKKWRRAHPETTIAVDGGIDFNNIASVGRAGADIAYVGKTIFGAGDPAENYKQLVKMGITT